MNAQSHKPYVLHARSAPLLPTLRSPAPPPQIVRSQRMSADSKIASGPFLFGLDKAAVLNDFSHSAFILDRTASVWRNEAYRCCCFVFSSCFFVLVLFLSSTRTKSTTSNEETIETAEKKNHNHQLYIANEASFGNKIAFDYSL